MLQSIIGKFLDYYNSRNRWWIPLAAGLLYPLSLPPFNHETHWIFAGFPFLTFVVLIPLFFFATRKPLKRALWHTYLFSFVAALGQFYWIGFVTYEGLWLLILAGMIVAAAYIGLIYLVAGIAFRFLYRQFPRAYLLLFPAAWVLIDYGRTLSDIAFPWAFLGYSFTPLLPLAQIASITGVWGLTFLAVLGNGLIWEIMRAEKFHEDRMQKWLHLLILAVFIGAISLWGAARMHRQIGGNSIAVSCIQGNLDPFHWTNKSLDTSFAITRDLTMRAAQAKPDLIIMPESALLCFLDNQEIYKRELYSWSDATHIPLLLGALHWDPPPRNSIYQYLAYNTAFFLDTNAYRFQLYRKIKLVPFSEALPFEAKLPLLSRVNLGQSDFKRGTEKTIYHIGTSLRAAPFICYEIIFPSFVRERMNAGADLIVNITNDAWFGKTTGPIQHATMARMRAIENGVSIARSANTGISLCADPFGRVLGKTSLYTRDILTRRVPIVNMPTFYKIHGDWLVKLCAVCVAAALVYFFGTMLVRGTMRRVPQETPATRRSLRLPD